MKNPAEDHFRNEITKARELKKHAVVAGCVPQGQPRSDYLQVCPSRSTKVRLLTGVSTKVRLLTGMSLKVRLHTGMFLKVRLHTGMSLKVNQGQTTYCPSRSTKVRLHMLKVEY